MKKAINLKNAMECYARLRNDAKTNIDENERALNSALAPLCAELDKVQARARVRTINAREVVRYLHNLEAHLNITKKALDGTSLRLDKYGSVRFPNAYKGTPESTIIEATYKSGSWRVTDIRRDRTGAGSDIELSLSETAKTALVERYSSINTYQMRGAWE